MSEFLIKFYGHGPKTDKLGLERYMGLKYCDFFVTEVNCDEGLKFKPLSPDGQKYHDLASALHSLADRFPGLGILVETNPAKLIEVVISTIDAQALALADMVERLSVNHGRANTTRGIEIESQKGELED